MKRHTTLLLLFFSWIAAAACGGLLANYLSPGSRERRDVTVRSLNVVDENGQSRITLQVRQNEPDVLLTSSEDKEIFRLHLLTSRSLDTQKLVRVPQLELNDSTGAPTVQLLANPRQRGLLAFSSPDRNEGKIMLGHFGVTDDGTDMGLWGLQIAGREKNSSITRMLGVKTLDNEDMGLVWPLSVDDGHRKIKQ